MHGQTLKSRDGENQERSEREFIRLTFGFVFATIIIFLITVCGALFFWLLFIFGLLWCCS
jgi:hypothetical protein